MRLGIKVCIFNILAAVTLHAHAEYYQVYSGPESSEACQFCQYSPFKHHRPVKVRHYQRVSSTPHRHHYHRNWANGLYISYPVEERCPCNDVWTLNYCQCCPSPNRVRSTWGDYVVFSSRPVDNRHGIRSEADNTFDPDLTTADDGRADLEINR